MSDSGTEARLALAREGYPFIAGSLVVAALLLVLAPLWLALPFGVLAALVVNFFRDPGRRPPADERLIVAPADGRVIKAESVDDPRFLNGRAQQVSIFMSPLDVHVNRNPISARVVDIRYNSGKYFRAFADKASLDNEQNAVVLEDGKGRRLAFVQIAGFLARRIVCYLRPGMAARRGERCGMIMFGSRVDVFMPPEARISVRVGSRTRAGETVIGEWMS